MQVEIVRAGGIPALVELLTTGSDNGREVAIGALHNLARRWDACTVRGMDQLTIIYVDDGCLLQYGPEVTTGTLRNLALG